MRLQIQVLDSARYFQTLTRYKYSGTPQNPNLNLYLEAVEFPDITQADGSNLSNISKKYTRYDSKGKLQESVDEAGTVIRYEYYELPNNRKNGYLKSVILDPGGLAIRTEHEVNDVGFVISVTNPLATQDHFWCQSSKSDNKSNFFCPFLLPKFPVL